MLIIQEKLIDIKTEKCIGVICINEDTSVPLSLEKARELDIEDMDMIEYLDVVEENVVINPRRPNFYAYVDKASGFLDNYIDVPYERVGDISNVFDSSEVIWGYVFKYLDFIELDNSVAIDRALKNFEACS